MFPGTTSHGDADLIILRPCILFLFVLYKRFVIFSLYRFLCYLLFQVELQSSELQWFLHSCFGAG